MKREDIDDYDIETESAMTEAEKRQVRIEDAIYDLETHFSTDYLVEAIREADEADLQALNEALKKCERLECWAMLDEIKSKWIAEFAKFQVDDRG